MKNFLKVFCVAAFIVAVAAIIAACGGGSENPDGTKTVTFTADAGIDWVAFQDGSGGTWNRKAPDSTDASSGVSTYAFTVNDPGGKYGIAYHRYSGQKHKVQVIRGTTGDLPAFEEIDGRWLNRPYFVNGTVYSDNPGDWATISLGSESLHGQYDSTLYEFHGTEGLNDLFAQQYEIVNSIVSQNKFVLIRDIDLSSGNVVGQDIDFIANGVAAVSNTITILNSPDATVGVDTKLFTANGTEATVNHWGQFFGYIEPGKGNYYLPASGLLPADLLSVETQALSLASGTLKEVREVHSAPGAGDIPIDLTDSAVAPYTTAGTVNTTSITGLSYSPSSGSPPLVAYAAILTSDRAEWIVIMTPGWLGGSTVAAMPDISGVSGYHPAWLPDFTLYQTGVAAFMRSDLEFQRHAGLVEHQVVKISGVFNTTVAEDNASLSGLFTVGSMETNLTNSAAMSNYQGLLTNGIGDYVGGGGSGKYTAYVDGTVSFDGDIEGVMSADGNILAVADTDYIDPDNRAMLALAIKNSTGLTNSVMSGEYMAFQFQSDKLGNAVTRQIGISSPGDGTADFEMLADSKDVSNVGTTGTRVYSIEPSGKMTLDPIPPGPVDDLGMVSKDGSVWFVIEPADPGDSSGTVAFIVGIRKGSGLDNSTLSGTYRLVQIGGEDDGSSSWASVMTVVPDGAGSLSISLDSRAGGIADGVGGFMTLPYAVNPDGTFTVTSPDGMDVEGIVSADGGMFIVSDTTTALSNAAAVDDHSVELNIGIRLSP